MAVEKILIKKIIKKRVELEAMISAGGNLHGKDIVECSEELDMLIIQYHHYLNWSEPKYAV